RNLDAFIGRVVDGVMEVAVADRPRRNAPDHQVCIGTDCNRTLAWMQPVGLCRVGGRELDEAIDSDAATQHAVREQKWKSRFDARDAVRDMAEGNLPASWFLALGRVIAKRSMVRREDGEQPVGKPVPDHLLVVAIARWRAAHAARAQVTIVDAEVF